MNDFLETYIFKKIQEYGVIHITDLIIEMEPIDPDEVEAVIGNLIRRGTIEQRPFGLLSA